MDNAMANEQIIMEILYVLNRNDNEFAINVLTYAKMLEESIKRSP